jgi:hypothetical protein
MWTRIESVETASVAEFRTRGWPIGLAGWRWEVMKRGSGWGNCVHLLDEMAVAARLVVSSERKMSDRVTAWLTDGGLL